MSTYSSIADAAELLNISTQRVRTLCRKGELQSEKIGNAWIVDQNSIKNYGLRTAHMIAQDHPAYVAETPSIYRKPIALSFFSGAMGLDLGLEKAGFDIRLACESNKHCRQTIALNRPNTALLGDINDCTAEQVLDAAKVSAQEVDLIVGGPPCQAFSTAGKRKAFNDDRGNAFLKYIDLAIEIRPRFIVIENVRGLLSCPMDHRPHNQRGMEFPDLSLDEMKGGALNFVISVLKRAGYTCTFNLYNSANFGTPQIRERVIIVCSRDGKEAPFLTPTHSENGSHGLPAWNKLRSALNGLDHHSHLNFPEKRLKYYRMLKIGENWRNLPPDLQKEALGKSYFSGGGKTGFLRRLHWDKPSPTLVTHPAMPATDLAHPEEDRPLSIQEYKRIQEFPDDWQLAGPLIEQYKQVGNAVPVSLGYAVGNLIRSLLSGKEAPPPRDFRFSRYQGTSHADWAQLFEEQKQKHQFNLELA
ncbi:modification methylase SinI [Pseudomonas fluorescens]|jgi:DNA (cytosine-5)-methyltransferase 1|uniref:Cytosine-specific methyltransferase n=1 Tax=Pseudomonas fluorescens TaxID=294 RepID=A0A423NAE8_PSEFL|nr:DNA cytosine methyltransferase [Pseudomonas fluorescens]RON95191.1 modification methylase SinI [Pseudomonas fluorescens]